MADGNRKGKASDTFSPPPNPGAAAKRVLVVYYGRLTGFIYAPAGSEVLRKTHPTAHITLLTSPDYAPLCRACPTFNDVVDISEQKDLKLALKPLKSQKFDIGYDFSGDESGKYASALSIKKWSGAFKGASHRHMNPEPRRLTQPRRLAEQLYHAGIGPNGVEKPTPWSEAQAFHADFSWLRLSLRNAPHLEPEYFSLYDRYALIVPAASVNQGEAAWPPEKFAALSQKLLAQNITPVLIGAKTEGSIGQAIQKDCEEAKNLITRTDLMQLITLLERALFVIGSDTGPVHLATMLETPGVCLFEQPWSEDLETEFGSVWHEDTMLARHAPTGGNIIVNTSADLDDISVEDVWRSILALKVF